MTDKIIKKIFSTICTLVTFTVIISLAIPAYRYISDKLKGAENPGFIESSEKDHKIILTITDVKSELNDIAELMTYSHEYYGTASITDKLEKFDIEIPGTEHVIKMTYGGEINVGYDLNDVTVDVDNNRKLIKIALGEQIINNNLPEENVETIERNNMFNKIRADEVTNKLREIKSQEYIKAMQLGIKDKAKENAEKIITDKLADFEGYEVKFI